jgi:hypothetical protein
LTVFDATTNTTTDTATNQLNGHCNNTAIDRVSANVSDQTIPALLVGDRTDTNKQYNRDALREVPVQCHNLQLSHHFIDFNHYGTATDTDTATNRFDLDSRPIKKASTSDLVSDQKASTSDLVNDHFLQN